MNHLWMDSAKCINWSVVNAFSVVCYCGSGITYSEEKVGFSLRVFFYSNFTLFLCFL